MVKSDCAQGRTTIEPGTRVRNKSTGEIGVVVYDFFRFCRNGNSTVIVEKESVSHCEEMRVDAFEILGEVKPVLSPKCSNCTFSNGSECGRYTAARMGMLSTNKSKIMPTKAYPDCAT